MNHIQLIKIQKQINIKANITINIITLTNLLRSLLYFSLYSLLCSISTNWSVLYFSFISALGLFFLLINTLKSFHISAIIYIPSTTKIPIPRFLFLSYRIPIIPSAATNPKMRKKLLRLILSEKSFRA